LHGGLDLNKKKELIDSFQLDPTKKSSTYSKGNRQKVALIAAFSCDAELYLFDEPTFGLDPLMEVIFQEYVKRLKEKGKSVL
jgi:ABC-2 type transport system ATP-binding protein